uniref:Receptor ligand binding region domain-containing protein n=1 Tax=Anopheles atroparvus TaxID=41427 RepID=A0A182IM67_ANOAO
MHSVCLAKRPPQALNPWEEAGPNQNGSGSAIFEQGTDEIQSAFKFAMLNHNLNVTARRFELQAYVDVINTADAFKLSRLICNQFSRGVFAMLGAVSPDSFDTLHSYSNTFQMPFVTPWFPEKVLTPSSGFLDFAISMRPDYYQAIIDTVRYYGWDRIIYMYDSHDEHRVKECQAVASGVGGQITHDEKDFNS